MYAKYLLGLSLPFLMLGCNSSSNDNESTTPSMVIGYGPIEGAKVCVDANKNYLCDDEVNTTTDANGLYDFGDKLDKSQSYNLVAEIEPTDRDSANGRQHKYHTVLLSDSSNGILSPFSTLAFLHKAKHGGSLKDAANSLSASLSDTNVSMLADYTSDEALQHDAHYLLSWMGITLKNLDHKLDENLSTTEVMNELYNNFESQTDVMKTYMTQNKHEAAAYHSPRMIKRETSQNVLYSWQPGMEYGRGFSDVTQSIIQGSNCLESFDTTWFGSAEENYEFILVQSEDDLSKNLNISGSISLGYEMISGSISGSYLNTYNKNSNSVFLLISYESKSGTYNVDNAVVSPDYKSMYDSDPNNFRKVCGDKFLVSATFGGQFLGLLEIKTNSLSEKRDIEAQLKGSYNGGVISVKVEGSFNQSLDSVLKQYSATVHVASRGGAGAQLEVSDLDTLKTQASDFITTTNSTCTKESTECFYEATFADYAVIMNNTATQSTLTERKKTMMPLYDAAISNKDGNSYENLRSRFEFIKTFAKFFDSSYTSASFLSQLSADITHGQALVENTANICATADEGSEPTTVCPTLSSAAAGYTPDEINLRLPATDYLPITSCTEFREVFNQTLTGQVTTLYIDYDLNKPFEAFCDGDNAFLILPYHSNPRSFFLRSNYFRGQNLVDAQGRHANMVTAYDKVKVEVQGQNLLVDTSDTTYASTYISTSEDANTSSLLFNDPFTGTTQVKHIPFGASYIGECPEKTVEQTIVETHEFEYVATQMSWEEASNYAKSSDATLATVMSSADHLAIASLMTEQGITDSFWIGLKESETFTIHHSYPPISWHTGFSPFGGGFSFFHPNYPRRGFDTTGVRPTYCYSDPQSNFQWKCSSDSALKMGFVMRYNTPKTETKTIEVADTSNCNVTFGGHAMTYGVIDFGGSTVPFTITDNNLFNVPGYLPTEITNAITTDSSNKKVTFGEPYPSETKLWSIPANQIELIYSN